MTASPILVNTTECVQTWLTTTDVIVWQDSMENIVKTVNTITKHKILVFLKYQNISSPKIFFDTMRIYVNYLFRYR